MTRNNELKEFDINNCACYYFGDKINIYDFDLDNVLLHRKSYENISIYQAAYKTPYDLKPLHIIFDKADGFI